jgi:transcriptional regulator with XRE-family HTH domain
MTIKPVSDDDIRERLKSYIRKRELTQVEFARMCVISPQYVSDILTGRRDTPNDVAQIVGYRRGWVRLP